MNRKHASLEGMKWLSVVGGDLFHQQAIWYEEYTCINKI
jgi:hypothetical protein